MIVGRSPGVQALTALLAVIALVCLADPASAEKRLALVIGNSAYADSPLRNPANDARLISRTLRALGFEVIERIDAKQITMKRAIIEFGDKLEKGGGETVGLFYYAGHGVQVDGVNYLIPIGANINREKDVVIEAVNAGWVLEQMDYARNAMNIVILDACRNNPFESRSFRSVTRGLARMDAPRGSLIAYATSPGSVAADGSGDNSPYTESLAEAMIQGGMSVEQMFKLVRKEVVDKTNDAQVPWESSSLIGDFYFKGDGGTATGDTRQDDDRRDDSTTTVPDTGKADAARAWQLVKDSKDPQVIRLFIDRYGSLDPFLGELAQIRLKALTEDPFAKTLQRAEAGELSAQLEAARSYMAKGDPQQALIWYRKAGRQGSAEAQFKVGELYLTHDLTRGDKYEQVMEWWELAANNGHAEAKRRLTLLIGQLHQSQGVSRFNGVYAGERGYTDPGRRSPSVECLSLYRFQVRIQDGQLSLRSDNRDWRGQIDSQGRVRFDRDGLSPKPKTAFMVEGPAENARMFSGYCGSGFFRILLR